MKAAMSYRPALENRENRLTPTVQIVLGSIGIFQTGGNDVAVVGAAAGQFYVLERVAGAYQIQWFNPSDVPSGGIYYCGFAGDDYFANYSNLISLAYGDAGNDVLIGGSNGDFLHGGDGNDELYDYGGWNRLYGEAGNDYLVGGDSYDNLSGGDGDDVMFAGGGSPNFSNGGAGNDYLVGSDGVDYMIGSAGNDVLWGLGNWDSMWGGEGDDFLYGGDGGDFLWGDDGWDHLYGERGNDYLNGGQDAYRDYLDGGLGADVLFYHWRWSSATSEDNMVDYSWWEGDLPIT
jgi:Ca2+-binding RTX toxin-like protein